MDMLPLDYADMSLEFTPVDEAARAVWLLRDCQNKCVHITNDKPITMRELARTLKGRYIPEVSQEKFENYLRQRLNEDISLAAFTELYSRMRIQKPMIETNCEITSALLSARGFVWLSPSLIDYSQLFSTSVDERRRLV